MKRIGLYTVVCLFLFAISSNALQLKESSAAALFGKCTVKVNIELDNGTTIEGTVVIEGDDMNVFKCAGIKLYGLLSNKY